MLWMSVTPDKYELPIAVAGSAYELATLMKTTKTNIKTKKSRQLSGKTCGYRVVCVQEEIPEDENGKTDKERASEP